jgi:hypothetical protein
MNLGVTPASDPLVCRTNGFFGFHVLDAVNPSNNFHAHLSAADSSWIDTDEFFFQPRYSNDRVYSSYALQTSPVIVRAGAFSGTWVLDRNSATVQKTLYNGIELSTHTAPALPALTPDYMLKVKVQFADTAARLAVSLSGASMPTSMHLAVHQLITTFCAEVRAIAGT